MKRGVVEIGVNKAMNIFIEQARNSSFIFLAISLIVDSKLYVFCLTFIVNR